MGGSHKNAAVIADSLNPSQMFRLLVIAELTQTVLPGRMQP